MSRRGAALALALALGACRSAAPPDAEIVVGRAPADGGAAEPAAKQEVKMSDGDGWLLDEAEQQNPKYTPRAEVLAAIEASPERALLVTDETIEECSSAGGSHVFFRLVEHRSIGRRTAPLASGLVHYGGHGATLMHAFAKGTHWVASIALVAPPVSVANPSWCVPDRTIHARAIALVPVASRDEGLALLRR